MPQRPPKLRERISAAAGGAKSALGRAARRSPAVRSAYHALDGLRHRARMRAGRVRGGGGVGPANFVWIFGSGRSGSSWLRGMLADLPGFAAWEEPMVGALFGDFYHRATPADLRRKDFIMSRPTRGAWISSVRDFVLDGARHANPGLPPENLLVVKEPNGSVGAPIIMRALPESRMVLLVRDPRDAVSSKLDAAKEGSWAEEAQKRRGQAKKGDAADRRPDAFVKSQARRYVTLIGLAREAYDAHTGPKTLVRYEDLRADARATMRRVYEELGLRVDGAELARVVEEHAWENIPDRKKGSGKFHRKGSPGGWNEDLTPEQVAVVEEITTPVLDTYYPGWRHP